MGKGFLPSATRMFGKQNLGCRIDDQNRYPIATIDTAGIIYNAGREKLGSVDSSYIVFDAMNKVIGRITPDTKFLDFRQQVIAILLNTWDLVGPDEQLIAVVRDGRILGPDRKDKLVYTFGFDARKVMAWVLYLADRSLLQPEHYKPL